MAESRLIQGRYRSLDLIGRGGMGEVWRARDESLGRQVAVKCLKPIGAEQDAHFTQVLRERFRREARVAASLQHRGVTVVHDFGDDSAAGGPCTSSWSSSKAATSASSWRTTTRARSPWTWSSTSPSRWPPPSATPTTRASSTAT